MKKNFFKKLSVVLALAMTVSAVAPAATDASAAAAPAFKSKSATVKVGQTKNYNMNNVTAYSVVKFVTGNKKVATVKKSGKTAKVTGVAEGKTTLRADLKAYKSKKELQVRIPVTVIPDKAVLSTVTQTKKNEVVAKFSAALTEANAADFSLVRDDNVVFPFKSVSLDSKDKTKVTITTYSDMKDGKTYTLSYDGKEVDFVATDGTVADVNVTPNVISAGKEKEIKVQTIDAKGVILSEEAFGSQSSNVSFTIVPDKGYTNGSKLYLPEIGDTAKATVEYHTYKYDTEGNEIGVIKKDITITAVKDDTVISNFNFTITDGNSSAPAWDATSFEANKKAKIDTNQYAYFKIKDSNGDEITNYSDYKVSSSDSSRLLVAEQNLAKNGYVDVKGVGEGIAYIVVKDATTGTTITTLQVTVIAKSKATTLSLSGTSFSVSTDAGITTTVKATVKDQYGNDLGNGAAYQSFDVEVLSKPKSTSDAITTASGKMSITNAANDHTITLTPSAIVGSKDDNFGAYTFKVSAKVGDTTVSRTFSYNIVKTSASATSTFDLVLSDNSVDTTVTNSTSEGKKINVKVGEFKNGVQVGTTATMESITLKKANGDVLVNTTTTATHAAISNAGGSIGNNNGFDIVVSTGSQGGNFDKKLEAGNYVITVVAGGKTLTKSFTVVDTQGKANIELKKTTELNGTLTNYFESGTDYVKFTYAGIEQTVTAGKIKDVDAIYLGNGGAFVKTVKVEVEVPGGNGNMVTVTCDVNQSLSGNVTGK